MPERKLNILDLIQGSFADADEEKVSKYLDRLYAAISDYTQNIRRDSLLVLLLVTAFELVNSSPGTQFSVASFSFHKGVSSSPVRSGSRSLSLSPNNY